VLQAVLATSLLAACASDPVQAKARKVDDTHWEGVQRIIAVGDIHGDYAQYIKVLSDAGLIDDRGRWIGDETHLVQTGDVPDRGADTRRILDHLEKLKKEARKKGGAVHTLIGNHEAMNVYGDLRYVTAGEFEAFQDRNSRRLWEAQWEHHLRSLEANDPEAFAQLDQAAFRADWEKQYPLGWVEHRNAWMPTGEYGKLVMDNPVVLKINDILFLHGGLSAKYCQLSLEEITEQVHEGIEHFDFQQPTIVEDELGPLWYRGLASESETVRGPMVDAILERYGASRIVVGHTVTQGVVWPRFDGKVILNDVGISAYYGGYEAFLELGPDGPVAHYGKRTLPIPAENDGRLDYLRAVVALQPTNGALQSRLQRMLAQAQRNPVADDAGGDGAGEAAEGSAAEGEAEDAAAAEAAQREAWLSPDNCR
jgi:hypothetical protein